MRNGFYSEHFSTDIDGKKVYSGGCTSGRGFTISWQHGPLGRDPNRREPNGAFVEDVIDAAKDRLLAFQKTAYCCEENALAIKHLESALLALESRTKNREARKVEGTWTP